MGDGLVLAEVREPGVALLTFNRPERMNAWTLALEDEYFDRLREAAADPEVRAIVVTGAGRAFSTGADFGPPATGADPTPDEYGQLHRRPVTLPLTIPKPIIGAINGSVAGVSLVQALQMDVRFAAAGAKFTFAFSKRGLVGEYCVTWLLPRLIGSARALELLLSSRVVLAEEAHELGLVHRVVPGEEVLEAALSYAADLATTCSPWSMANIKQQLLDDWTRDLETARVETARLMRESFAAPDFREGVRSFLEKRSPAFPPIR